MRLVFRALGAHLVTVSAAFAGQSTVPHLLPQAQPGSVYNTQLSIPPGLGYPFTCTLTGDTLPKGLTFECDRLQLRGRIPQGLDKTYNIVLQLVDAGGNSKSFVLQLRVSAKPEVVSLASPTVTTASDRGSQPALDAVTQPASDAPDDEDPGRPVGGAAGAIAKIGQQTPETPSAGPSVTPTAQPVAPPSFPAASPVAPAAPLPAPVPGTLAISPQPRPNDKQVAGTGDPKTEGGPDVKIYVCVSQEAAPPAAFPDCSTAAAAAYEAPLSEPAAAGASPQYVVTASKGNFIAQLSKPLPATGYVWLAENNGGGASIRSRPVAIVPATSTPPTLPFPPQIAPGAKSITGQGQSSSPLYPSVQIYVCHQPKSRGVPLKASPDCSLPNGPYLSLREPLLDENGHQVSFISTDSNGNFTANLDLSDPRNQLKNGDYVSVVQVVTPAGGAENPHQVSSAVEVTRYDGLCSYEFNDCDFDYSLVGGVEQADLSAQSSYTTGFFFLFVRAPVNMRWGSVWLRTRFLGANSASSTNNIVAAATNPTGNITASTLPQSVNSVDYVFGVDHQFWLPGHGSAHGGQFTFGPVAGFGATTPLDSSNVVNGVTVPAYGTAECNQLQQRFTLKLGYNPPLPGSGIYDTSGDIGCVVQPPPNATTTTGSTPGTQIKYLAFSNQDRSSFLLKWGAGVRLINRWHSSKTDLCSSGSGKIGDYTQGRCIRSVVDFTLGQDQDITGGYLRHFVLKGDADLPLAQTGIYFFGQSATRLVHNNNFAPLILTPATISTTTSTSTTTVTIPSSDVFVLPYKQQNRDFYSIGLGLDLQKIFTKMLSPSSK
jgi:hypothetical protein